jgi:hypothetical protein
MCSMCPADHTVACGASCCLPGAECTNGTCSCPANEAACGDVCCSAGAFCDSAGQCARCDSSASTACGDLCCGAGLECKAGRCVSPAPPPTGTTPGGACTSNHHWEPMCNKCCINPWVCCAGLDGALDCNPSAFCQ